MLSKPEKNYFVNIVLIVMSLVCIVTGFLLDARTNVFNVRTLHIWSGYIMTGLFAIHILMHIEWLTNLTKTIFRNKIKVMAALATLIVSVGVCYSIAAFSPQQRLSPGFQEDGGRAFRPNRFDQSNQVDQSNQSQNNNQ